MSREKQFEALVTLAGTVDSSLESALSKTRNSLNDLDSTTLKVAGSVKNGSKISKVASYALGALSNTVGGLLKDGINAVGSAISGSLDSAIDRVDTLNAYEKTMQNLGYSIDEVAAASKTLQEGIDGLPTTLPGITSMQQQYAALTGDIGLAADLTVALNDATLAGGQGQEVATRAAEQWYKVIAKGKPDLQSWTTINSAMPAQMNQIAQSLLGAEAKSQDLFEAWKSGKITTEQVQQAVIDLDKKGSEGITSFAEQAQDASGGIKTSMTNIKTAITTGVANVIEGIDEFTNIAGTLNIFKGGIKAAFGDVADALPLLVEGLKTGDFEAAIDKIGHVFESLTEKIDFQKISETIGQLAPVLVAGVLQNLPAIAEAGIQIIIGLIEGLSQGLPVLLDALPSIVAELVNVLVQCAPDLALALTDLFTGAIDGLTDILPGLLSELPSIVVTVFSAVVSEMPAVLLHIIEQIGSVKQIFVEKLSSVKDILFNVIALAEAWIFEKIIQIQTMFREKLNSIKSTVSEAMGSIPIKIGEKLEQAKSSALAKLAQIHACFQQKLALIKQTVSNVLSRIPQIISEKLSGAASSARQALQRVKQAFIDKLNEIKNWVTNKLAEIRNAFAHPITTSINLVKNVKEKISKSEGKAKGGFTRGVTIAGEDPRYPVEAVLSFNPKYRDQNIAYWAKAGRMLGASASDMSNVSAASYYGAMPGTNEAYSARVGRSLSTSSTQAPVNISSPVSRSKNTVNMGGITFSPTIKVETKNGEKVQPETILKALRDFEPEFVDFVMQALAAREEGAYVTEGAGLY